MNENPSNLEATRLSNDENFDKNLRDSVIQPNINASAISEVKNTSMTNIVDNKNASIIARRASDSIQNYFEIPEKDNAPPPKQVVENTLNTVPLPGFTTLKTRPNLGGLRDITDEVSNIPINRNMVKETVIQR